MKFVLEGDYLNLISNDGGKILSFNFSSLENIDSKIVSLEVSTSRMLSLRKENELSFGDEKHSFVLDPIQGKIYLQNNKSFFDEIMKMVSKTKGEDLFSNYGQIEEEIFEFLKTIQDESQFEESNYDEDDEEEDLESHETFESIIADKVQAFRNKNKKPA